MLKLRAAVVEDDWDSVDDTEHIGARRVALICLQEHQMKYQE